MSTTLLKCLKVIETLAQSDEPRGISELAREVGLRYPGNYRARIFVVQRFSTVKTVNSIAVPLLAPLCRDRCLESMQPASRTAHRICELPARWYASNRNNADSRNTSLLAEVISCHSKLSVRLSSRIKTEN